MIRFLKKTINFMLLAGITFIPVSYITKEFLFCRVYNANNLKFAHEKNILLLGACDTEFSFDPAVIDNAINVATPAENAFYAYHKALFLLKANPQIHTIIMGYAYVSTSKNLEADMFGKNSKSFLNRFFMLLDNTGREVIKKPDNKYYIVNLLKYQYGVPLDIFNEIELFVKILLGNIQPEDYQFMGGFQKDMIFFKRQPSTDPHDALARHFYSNNEIAGKSDITIDYLGRIASMCRDNNINLIFIITPLREDYLQKVPTLYRELSRETMQKLKNINPSLQFYDYSNFLTDPQYFVDCDHLNEKGAEIFSREIKKSLNL